MWRWVARDSLRYILIKGTLHERTSKNSYHIPSLILLFLRLLNIYGEYEGAVYPINDGAIFGEQEVLAGKPHSTAVIAKEDSG